MFPIKQKSCNRWKVLKVSLQSTAVQITVVKSTAVQSTPVQSTAVQISSKLNFSFVKL